jgi:hypothetical protein
LGAVLHVGDLGSVGDELGNRGEGSVSRLTQHPGLVFKRYHDHIAVNRASLERLVTIRAELSADEQAELDEMTAWPLHVVVEGRRCVGFVMREIADDYIAALSTGLIRPRELQYLFYADHSETALGITMPTCDQVLEICVQFVRVVASLHRVGVEGGDISMANVLWKLTPDPRVMLIDCDSWRPQAHSHVGAGLPTPDWDDPKLGRRTADGDSDNYKVALAIYRTLIGDHAARPDPGAEAISAPTAPMTPELASLALAATTAPAGGRPETTAWSAALARAPRGTRAHVGAARPKSRLLRHRLPGPSPSGVPSPPQARPALKLTSGPSRTGSSVRSATQRPRLVVSSPPATRTPVRRRWLDWLRSNRVAMVFVAVALVLLANRIWLHI